MLKPKKNELRKPTRTISGITPVAVMLPPRKCKHGNCTYCPNLDVPQSYTPKSPVVMRAARVNYDSFKQVKARIKAFQAMNHKTEKIELIIMGGTFMEYPKRFQYEFIKGCYDALNKKKSKDLENAKKLNEKSLHRCVALCVETRPDVIDIKKMGDWGVTRVELGVQIIDDKIYKLVKRGHTVKDVEIATKKLKDAGFKIGYHVMPGLPGSNLKKDLELFKKVFSDSRFKPDQLKIYPCQVMPGSELEKLYWKGKYKPYNREELEKLLLKMLKAVPKYCRVMRVMREIPPEFLVAGTKRIDLRKVVEQELRKNNTKLKEIRYREVGFNPKSLKEIPAHPPEKRRGVSEDLKLKTTKYKASGGDEYFLEVVNRDDILFGLLRLRIASLRSETDGSEQTSSSSSLKNSVKMIPKSKRRNVCLAISKQGGGGKFAVIRELHVYGPTLKLGEIGKLSQHKGIGKWLMTEAEKIVVDEKIKELRVISGVGVREYYKKLGYKLDVGGLMVKKL